MDDDVPEMVMRVAIELADELGQAYEPALCVALATRAIETLRQPTEAMVRAFREKMWGNNSARPYETVEQQVADVFGATIDAALGKAR